VLMRMTCFGVLSIGLVACSANAPSATAGSTPTDTAKVKTAIESANARFLDAFKRGDKATMIANYVDDAVLMMPNEQAWHGHAEIEKGLSAFVDQMTFKNGRTITSDVMVAGDLAVETGRYAWTLRPKEGPEITDKGKYLTAWKRQSDGSWKVVRDINNSDMPFPR